MAAGRHSVTILLLMSYLLVSSQSLHVENIQKPHNIDGRIKTIVVVVMENRSFDHILGWLKSTRPEIDGLTGKESNSLNISDPNSSKVFVSDDAVHVDMDPAHSFQAIQEQIFGSDDTTLDPKMNGFAQQAEKTQRGTAKTVMSGFKPEILPVYTQLANEFAVFDRWFASVPSSTLPNRFYVHSATSHGCSSNINKGLIQGFPQKTIFDSLEENDDLSFGIYHHNIPTTLFFKSLRKLKHLVKFHSYAGKFKLDAKLGRLPSYTVVEPRYFDVDGFPANDDHPSHDVAEGQRFVKEVYEAVRSSPQWKELALIITYDEHGGFFDHVPTPVEGVPNPDDIIGPGPFYFGFDRLGVRVPTLLISPWIDKGTVIHEPDGRTSNSQYEHSSIPATVKKLFNLKSNFLTKRDAWAGTFDKYFYLRDSPRQDCPETLAEVKGSLRPWGPREDSGISEFQMELVQLASQLVGDHLLNSYPNIGKNMTVGKANKYAEDATLRFLEAGKAAIKSGADGHAIMNMRPSLTTRISQ
ncbi:Non-specific phospholipase C1 [Raphanus sativus]|uniref:Non-specific phospholipase C1-like n=1 Tax=Raphanus sativus TaxID=3726 RepID=A0A6J0NTQ1_RAPSA|nr:non-specific phospholipase C1-like [Raphanus sativus]KAJ4893436.1 Non-specific phospholipase C1 [Raphanus sativus]